MLKDPVSPQVSEPSLLISSWGESFPPVTHEEPAGKPC